MVVYELDDSLKLVSQPVIIYAVDYICRCELKNLLANARIAKKIVAHYLCYYF